MDVDEGLTGGGCTPGRLAGTLVEVGPTEGAGNVFGLLVDVGSRSRLVVGTETGNDSAGL